MFPTFSTAYIHVGDSLTEALINTITTNKKTTVKVVFIFGGGGENRTRVRKPSALGSTCLADSLNLVDGYPNGRENQQRSRLKFNESTSDKHHRGLVRVDARHYRAQALQ